MLNFDEELTPSAQAGLRMATMDMGAISTDKKVEKEKAPAAKSFGRIRVEDPMADDAYIISSCGGRAGDFRLAANLSDHPKTIEGILVPARSAEFLPLPAAD